LSIGGVKDKTIAAKRAGIFELIFPYENKAHYMELPFHIRQDLTARFVESYDDVYYIAFGTDAEIVERKTIVTVTPPLPPPAAVSSVSTEAIGLEK